MTAITVEEMQRDLRGYLSRVESGETITILQADQPVAELKPLRPIGLYEGEFVVPDDFDDPLPDSILKGFEGR